MNALSALRRVSRRANILLLAAVMMTMLTVMFVVLTSAFSRIIKAGQTKLANQQVAHAEQRLQQALRLTFYNKFWDMRLNQPAGTVMTENDVNDLIAQIAPILGQRSGSVQAGAPFDMQMANGKVSVTITPNGNPNVMPKAPPGGGLPMQAISGTGTWLDGAMARVHELPIQIDLTAASGLGSSTEIQTTIRPRILFCEIPQSSLALVSEGDLTGGIAGTTVAGASRIKGNIANTGNIAATGAVVYNQASSGNFTQRATSQEHARSVSSVEAANFRYQTEIEEYGAGEGGRSGALRSTGVQRVVDPVSLLPTDVLFREGLSQTVPLSKQAAYQAQPYYQVPVTYRVFGMHNPNNSSTPGVTPNIFTPRPPAEWPAGDGGNLTNHTQWAPWIKNIATITIKGLKRTVFQVDLAPLIAASPNLPLRVFIGAYLDPALGGGPADFSRCYVMLQPLPKLQVGAARPSSVTIITPNVLVFEGEFNNDPTDPTYVPVPTSLIASSVRFSFTAPSVVTLDGTVRGKNDLSNVMSVKSADNSQTAGGTVRLKATTTPAAAAGDLDSGSVFYITLLRQS